MFRLKIILAYQKHSSYPLLEGSLHACTGRALEWHSRGQRFDPAYLHQNKKDIRKDVLFIVSRKPLARRVVQKKPYGDDVDRKTPFAQNKSAVSQLHEKAKGGH